MNIILYNINSFGGNYEYAKYLFEAYGSHPDTGSCQLLMPANAQVEEENIFKFLLSDLPPTSFKPLRKLYYLYRSVINPFRLFCYIRKQKSQVVLFNDFDQITAFLWAPFFYLLRRKHTFAVLLHDPDRDRFFPFRKLSEWTMAAIMSFMHIAFYHGFLPVKKYYKGKFLKVPVPHGIYSNTEIDRPYLTRLKALAGNNLLLGILGNIRAEKNYETIIDSLVFINHVKLLVAGSPSNSAASVDTYKKYAEEKNVSDRIIWKVHYHDQPAFNAAIAACDIILLYYKPSFTSQSGVLNSIAAFKKRLVVSDTKSSLCKTVREFNLGEIVAYDQPERLAEQIDKLQTVPAAEVADNWNHYIEEVSWEKHVSIAMEQYKKVRHEV